MMAARTVVKTVVVSAAKMDVEWVEKKGDSKVDELAELMEVGLVEKSVYRWVVSKVVRWVDLKEGTKHLRETVLSPRESSRSDQDECQMNSSRCG